MRGRSSRGGDYPDDGRAQSAKPSALESFAAGASALSKLSTRSSLEEAAFESRLGGGSDDENRRSATRMNNQPGRNLQSSREGLASYRYSEYLSPDLTV